MWVTRPKSSVVILAVATSLAASGLFALQALADKPPVIAQAAEEPKTPQADEARRATGCDLTPENFAKLHALIRPHDVDGSVLLAANGCTNSTPPARY